MSTFIHYSHNNKVYNDKDFDSIQRTGIEVKTKNGRTDYTANTLTQYKTFKTLRGAENFMKKSGRKPIAIEENKQFIYLTSSAERANRKRK